MTEDRHEDGAPGTGFEEGASLNERLRGLEAAHEARGHQLARERWAFADRLRQETESRDREIEELHQEVGRLESEVEGKQRELESLLHTRTFRYTAWLRGLWSGGRRRS
jgi:predicted RNase H-like nuclease (RuvC/YqgF family)